MTEVFLNGNLIDISDSEIITFTKSVFDINNLSFRKGTYSNTFKIPKTQKNKLVLQSSEIVNSSNDEPYTVILFRAVVEGVETINGVAELIDSDEENYSLSVKSDNGNFFKEIKELSLQDISEELESLDHTYSATEVNARRDVDSGLVYPNVDYGWFERATLGNQPYDFFYPALYFKFVIDTAINKIGYKQIGNFWGRSPYSTLALMAKNIVSDASFFEVSYGIESGFNFFITRSTELFTDRFIVSSALNFVEENSDDNGLYKDTDLDLGYTVFAYNIPFAFDSNTTWETTLNGLGFINSSVVGNYRDEKIERAQLIFKLQLYNKVTDTFIETSVQFNHIFYEATYVLIASDPEFVVERTSETFLPEIQISDINTNPSGLNAIGADGNDYVLLWDIQVQTDTNEFFAVSEYDSLDQISVELDFGLKQITGGDPTLMSTVNSFDNVNIGNMLLYVSNVTGTFPLIDEALKTVRMIEYDTIKRNKTNALDWSNKIDLSEKGNVSFKLNYAKRNLFKYENDEADVWLLKLVDYGQGSINLSNENAREERTMYQAPFSLCAVDSSFNNSRTIGKIFTGEKYFFNGNTYELDPEASVGGFKNRVVNLSRSTSDLIQITGADAVGGNYEVNNAPILFDRVIQTKYNLIKDILNKTKVVNQAFRINSVDYEQFDFTKPVFVSYYNDIFLVNEITQFKINEIDSTEIQLIRI